MRKIVKNKFILFVLLLFYAIIADAQKRPVIGISDLHKDGTNAAVPRSYVDAVLQTGGVPVVIPLMHDNEIIELLNSLDGIIFTGGEDFDPSYYNERPIPQMGKVNAIRDDFDIRVLRLAAERGLPILGICRGVQLINIVYGGSLYQDISAQYHDNSIRHRQRQPKEEASHSVLVEDNTVFADIVKDRMLMVNSSHHQAIKKVADGFRIAGRSPDKIVEVIEKIDSENWILGVQFHPETRVLQDNAMRKIFRSFIEEASKKDNPFERVRIASASRPQVSHDPVYTSRSTSSYTPISEINKSVSASKESPQPIYKSNADTQFIYKIVVDTQYIFVQADTVYKTNVEKQYVHSQVDTVYLPVVDTQFIYSRPDTVYLSVVDAQPVASGIDTFYIFMSDTVYINNSDAVSPGSDKPEVIPVSDIIEKDPVQAGNMVEKSEKKDEDIQKEQKLNLNQAKKEQKLKEKQAKEELKLKEKQAKKELLEKEQQAKKELAEKKEKEKWAKKEAEEKERQFKKSQEENAKLDKKEMKEAKTNM